MKSNFYDTILAKLRNHPKIWCITGVAGFIGSNLLETLLQLDQRVVGLDNFSTGHQKNLEEVKALVKSEQWSNFHLVQGDIGSLEDCRKSMSFKGQPVDYVLHQAALGSVPRSISDPIETNRSNIDGFVNMILAAKDAKVINFVYASSSAVYGDEPNLPKVEDKIGNPLSPYAVSKRVNELYADVFHRAYGFDSIGLRYFNVFGRRQDPEGAYAAVIPKWIAAIIKGEQVFINGDGETSRDFCYIDNVIQANVLAAVAEKLEAKNRVYNVAVGEKTSLNELYQLLLTVLLKLQISTDRNPIYKEFRSGDVKHSLADIEKARRYLKYQPTIKILDGLQTSIDWYVLSLKST